MDKLDQIYNVVVETQSQVSDLRTRMTRVEDVIDKTYNKFDEFMTIVNRYEAEIASIRVKYERLEDRVLALESRLKA